MKIFIASAIVIASCLITPAVAGDEGVARGSMGHGTMKAPDEVRETEAKAVINSVDLEGGKINVTHEPVKVLGWPTMTMDLPVTRRVDLSAVKTGKKVIIKLKKGRDKMFRVVSIEEEKSSE